MSAVQRDSSGHQCKERCTHVYDALIDEQNVYRLHNKQRPSIKALSLRNMHNKLIIVFVLMYAYLNTQIPGGPKNGATPHFPEYLENYQR